MNTGCGFHLSLFPIAHDSLFHQRASSCGIQTDFGNVVEERVVHWLHFLEFDLVVQI